MAVFSTNQNRHFYVAKSYNDSGADGGKSIDDASVNAGAIEVKSIGEGNNKELIFLYKNPDKEIIKSDRIKLKNLDYIKAFNAADMVIPLKKVEVTLDPNINSGAPITGQDYILGINFRQWVGSDEKYTYYKDAAVHVTSAIDNAKKFFDAMKAQLDLAFARELGATKTSNPYLDFTVSGSGANAKLVITEKPQDWTLGIESQESVLFDVIPTTIYNGGDDVIWGVVTPVASTKTVGTDAIGNGHKIADLEWFCMGERGDQYRYKGWPNYIPTKYMVDPALQYNVLEIHHAFTDTGVNSYRSEKDITIVASEKNVLNAIISAINTAAGSTIVQALS